MCSVEGAEQILYYSSHVLSSPHSSRPKQGRILVGLMIAQNKETDAGQRLPSSSSLEAIKPIWGFLYPLLHGYKTNGSTYTRESLYCPPPTLPSLYQLRNVWALFTQNDSLISGSLVILCINCRTLSWSRLYLLNRLFVRNFDAYLEILRWLFKVRVFALRAMPHKQSV